MALHYNKYTAFVWECVNCRTNETNLASPANQYRQISTEAKKKVCQGGLENITGSKQRHHRASRVQTEVTERPGHTMLCCFGMQ